MKTVDFLAVCISGMVIFLASADTAQAQKRITAPSIDSPEAYSNAPLEERLKTLPDDLAAEVREHFSRAAEAVRLRTEAQPPLPAPSRLASERQKISGVSGVVTVSVRCASGYVVRGRYDVTAPDVVIESEEPVDCDRRGCRAFAVIAKRVSTAPYDLDVSVTCA
jgi:hypothetical protein